MVGPQDTITEEWRTVTLPGFDMYEVSSRGAVRRGNRVLSGTSYLGYRIVGLHARSKRKMVGVHRLVALAFIGEPPDGKPEANHINFVRDDNRAENLEWASHSENMKHSHAAGRLPSGDRHGCRLHPDMVARGDRHGSRTRPDRVERGEDKWSAVLSEASVRAIRDLHRQGLDSTEMALRFGVNPRTIRDVTGWRTWKHVK